MSTTPKTTQKWILIVGGTAVTLLVAGLLYQVIQPEEGVAATRNARKSEEQSTSKSRRKHVARVNNMPITYEQLAEECVARHGTQVLEGLINRTLIEQSFKNRPDAPTGLEVDRYIRDTAKKFNMTAEQWLQMMQTQEETTIEQYRRDVIWPILALRKLAGSEIEITAQELQEAYERNYGPRVRARIIVLDRPRQATQVWNEAVAHPEEFGRLAMKHSVDPSSRALEGVVHPIPRHSGSKAIEEAAFRLREGEVSGVIQIPENKHWIIIKCEGHTQPVEVAFEEVRPMLETELRDAKVKARAHATFEKLKDQARIDNYLTGVTTGSDNKVVARPGSSIRQASGTQPATRRQAPARK